MAEMTEAELTAYRRAQCAARRAFERMRCNVLRGDDALAAEVRADWKPIRQFQQEIRRHERAREEEDPCCGAAFN